MALRVGKIPMQGANVHFNVVGHSVQTPKKFDICIMWPYRTCPPHITHTTSVIHQDASVEGPNDQMTVNKIMKKKMKYFD